jgi:Insect cuticle protein
VITHDEHHGPVVDYIAKPDYQFEYGVEDPKTKLSQFRKENRNDDAVVGEYSYTDPLGHVRTVKYTADKVHGFRAEIYVDGKLETPGAPQQHHYEQPQEEEEAQISEGYQEEGDY